MRWSAVGIATVLFALGGCGSDASSDAASGVDDVEVAADDGSASANDIAADLVTVLRESGLASAASAIELVDFSELTDSSEFTLLAPNDEAFLALDADQAADLLSDPTSVADVFRNHIIPSRMDAADLGGVDSVDTEWGSSLAVTSTSDLTMIDDGTVVLADIEVGDVVVHVVDRLFLP